MGTEHLLIEGVGASAIRVRATQNARLDDNLPSGLLPEAEKARPAKIRIEDTTASITHGRLRAEVRVRPDGLQPSLELSFFDIESRTTLLEEQRPHILYPDARNYDAVTGDLWQITTEFAAHEGERFYGLGQHQHGRLDQKGCDIDI